MIKTAVFVAAGLGSRLKDRTKEIPKGFLPVGGTPLIKRSLALLKKAGIERFIFGTGYHSHFYEEMAAEDPDMQCVKSPVYRETSSFYTLYNLRKEVKEDFLLLESDLIYEYRALDTLLKDPRNDLILASGATLSDDEVFIHSDEKDRLIQMSKNPQDLESITGELVGISKVSLSQFDILCRLAEEDEQLLMKGDYESAFVRASAKKPFYITKVEDLLWAEIDDEDHLRRTEEKILPRLKEIES